MAFLNKGLEINFRDERVDPVLEQTFKFTGGITDFVKHLNESKEPLFKRVVAFNETGDDYEVDVAMQWNTGYYEGIHSFANNIATTEGGMHEEGFKKALTNVVNRYAKGKGLLKEKDDNLLGEDIREGLTAIVSVKLRNPQFEGQTKAKLGNTEMRSLVEKATNEKLADWLEEHPTEARQALAKANQAATARMAARQARDLTRRKSLLESSAMPGKLADCSSKNPAQCELFIVEGDSAGGPAKKARNPEFQAILPIRGKILNVERARIDRMLKNEEIQALITAIGTGLGEEFDIEKLRYHKIVLMTDADVDGAHIRTLLLTFFYRQFGELVRGGNVYVAQPPLFRADLGKERNYLKDEAALRAFEAEHPRPQDRGQPVQGSRRDGLAGARRHHDGPDARSLLQVSVEDAAIADDVFSRLMGDDVESRKTFIQEQRERRAVRRRLSGRSAIVLDRTPGGGERVPDGTQPTLEPNIEPIEIQEEMERSFLDYAMSVITARALPDARDGLKPVHRRILYGMYAGGLRPDRKHQKSAPAVGDVMGKFHPHGDQAIYDALARMAQDFSLRYPLVDGHGNFGSPDPNDRPAAMRYTEARLAPLAMQLLARSTKTPSTSSPPTTARRWSRSVLPARFPNLLVNGGGGIAVGMATNIPPHNLGEVIDATCTCSTTPRRRTTTSCSSCTGPDFPTGALILGRSGIHDAYRTGRGSIKMRAVAEIEETEEGPAHRRHRDAVPDLGRGDRPEDRRARERPQDRRHPRRAQRVVG